jgi:type I restriction enzyme, R subunit
MKTDTSEKGLETLIMRHMTGVDGLSSGASGIVAETAPQTGGSGWFAGHAASYDREFAVDVEQLFAFLLATQPEETAAVSVVWHPNVGRAHRAA